MQTAILTERAASLPSLQSNSVSDYFDFSVSIFRGLAAFLRWTSVDRSAPRRTPRYGISTASVAFSLDDLNPGSNLVCSDYSVYLSVMIFFRRCRRLWVPYASARFLLVNANVQNGH